MRTLLAENFDKTSKFIFDFYDFDKDGYISREDIRVVLSYVSLSNNNKKTKNFDLNHNGSGAYSNNCKSSLTRINFESYLIICFEIKI